MLAQLTEPIPQHWTTTSSIAADPSSATASDVSSRLAQMRVADIDADVVPFLAAAAAELALVSGTSWRFSADDPPVALLRLIAKVTIRHPEAGGPHTARLLERLR